MLLSNLPVHLRDTWNMEVQSIIAKHSRETEFKDLIKYVDKDTTLVSDSLFSREAVEQYLDKRDANVDKKRRLRNYAM